MFEEVIIPEFRLPKNFLKENPLKEISTAQITYIQMVTVTWPGFNEEIADIVAPKMEISKREAYELEKEQILKCDTAEDVIKYMRITKELQNRYLLVEKALVMQEDIMPLILKRLLTSAHDVFIENAAIILANADMKYVEQLFNIFKEIRNPYARSETSIVFGVNRRADYISLLWEQYTLIKQERPDKDYEQGPLWALHLIHEI
jgi:hypothetical protein